MYHIGASTHARTFLRAVDRSTVDVAINFHVYLLFCGTSLIIKNKSIFNGLFESREATIRRLFSGFVGFDSSYFAGCFGLKQLAHKLVASKCCVFFGPKFNKALTSTNESGKKYSITKTLRLGCKTRQLNWQVADAPLRISKSVYDSQTILHQAAIVHKRVTHMFAKWLTIRIRPNAIHKEYCANPKTMTRNVMKELTRLAHPLVSKCSGA